MSRTKHTKKRTKHGATQNFGFNAENFHNMQGYMAGNGPKK